MKRFFVILLAFSLLLSGCSLFRGSFVSVTPHQYTGTETASSSIAAGDYTELLNALKAMVREGRESFLIDVSGFESALMEWDVQRAVSALRQSDPIGAYAVEDIRFSLGINGMTPAVAVEVSYRHGAGELRQLQSVRDMDAVQAQIGRALDRCDTTLTLLVNDYNAIDFQQLVEDYAEAHPDLVMEVPTVVKETYPALGKVRVLALRFNYQNSRDDLQEMKQQVSPVFVSASLYVSGDDAVERKFSQLYAFLRERFSEYQLKTSITPAYSLLRHGVGDSRAFATVYARMCDRAGLSCQVVTGTRDGDAWSWNLIHCDGRYYHVDLLDEDGSGQFRMRTDDEMERYVWDYSAFPASPSRTPEPGSTNTQPDSPGATVPDRTEPSLPPEPTAPVPPETTAPTDPAPAPTEQAIPTENNF